MTKEFRTQVRVAVRDEAALRAALTDADIAPLLMVLVNSPATLPFSRR